MMTPSGKTKVYAVIGDPIEHSLSPALQNAAFEAGGMDCVFLAFKVAPAQIEGALRGMRALGIAGLNVTMPDKSTVIPFLDEIDETAQFLDSVNTIFNDSGRLRGFSTDGAGAHRALEDNGVRLQGKKLVLLGGGGAARAIAYALAKEVGKLVLLNRTPEKTASLAQAINKRFHGKITTGELSAQSIKGSLQDADILINATSVGMHPNAHESLVNRHWLKPEQTVLDIVYNPLETKLAKDAKSSGCKVINGLEMLIYQGAASFEIWTGKAAPVEVMRQAALKQLKNR